MEDEIGEVLVFVVMGDFANVGAMVVRRPVLIVGELVGVVAKRSEMKRLHKLIRSPFRASNSGIFMFVSILCQYILSLNGKVTSSMQANSKS